MRSEPFAPLARAVRAALSPDLLRPQYAHMVARGPTAGHCYAASEAMLHLLAARGVHGYVPHSATCPGGVHWWLQARDGAIVDVTADQFDAVTRAAIYARGRGRGFLTRAPSRRAAEIIRRVNYVG